MRARCSQCANLLSIRRAGAWPRGEDPFTTDPIPEAPDDRARLVGVIENAAARAWFRMRHNAETLGGGWARMWDEGVGEAIRRRQAWLAEHRETLHRAVAG